VQDSSKSLSGCKCESWARATKLVDKTEPGRATALMDAVVFAVGMEHADKLGEHPFLHLATFFSLTSICWTVLLSHCPCPHST